MGLLFNLVFIHNHGPEFFLPHPYLRHLEEDGTISNIFKFILNNLYFSIIYLNINLFII